MSLSTRAEPANLPARRHPELRVEQPDGSLLTLTEHLERNGTQPWTFPHSTGNAVTSANLPAVRPRAALAARTLPSMRALRLGPTGRVVLAATIVASPIAGLVIGLLS